MNSPEENIFAHLERLQSVKNELGGQFDLIEIKGKNMGSYIYIEHQNRSLELFKIEDGNIVIGLCDGHTIYEVEVDGQRDDYAFKILKDWLIKRSDLKEYPFIEWKKE